MPPGLLTVAPVLYECPVKDLAPPPKNLVVSALSCIHCLSQCQKSRRLRAFLPLPLSQSCGVIGHAVSLAEPGYGGSGVIWSQWKLHPFRHLPHRLPLSRVLSERIGG
jgi:hypothetical protein